MSTATSTTTTALTADQKAFLEECAEEFSGRFTDDDDADYRRVHASGIPPPPITCPWYGRPKMAARHRAPGNSRSSDRDHHDRKHGEHKHRDRRYRPY